MTLYKGNLFFVGYATVSLETSKVDTYLSLEVDECFLEDHNNLVGVW